MSDFTEKDSQRFGKAFDRSNFTETCNLLSQFLKEKRSSGNLSLGPPGKMEPRGNFCCFVFNLGFGCLFFLVHCLSCLCPSHQVFYLFSGRTNFDKSMKILIWLHRTVDLSSDLPLDNWYRIINLCFCLIYDEVSEVACENFW